jgi:hemerythrin
MALLTWGDKYSVGIETIDKQHKGLFDSLNDLHGAMMKGQGQTLTGPILQQLVKYTRDHFSAEESMMVATKYPQLDQHRTKHRDFTKQVMDFVARFERGEATLTLDLMKFLRDWLTAHIQGEDSKYGPWLTERGVR